LAEYEDYRNRMAGDRECQDVLNMEIRNRSIISYERSFMRPVLD
ncbi:MAG TPA: NIPSNAP family protein, partial [Thalassospira sp.]|nr:NIPSNAP family protein [Thalassospira sp.]